MALDVHSVILGVDLSLLLPKLLLGHQVFKAHDPHTLLRYKIIR